MISNILIVVACITMVLFTVFYVMSTMIKLTLSNDANKNVTDENSEVKLSVDTDKTKEVSKKSNIYFICSLISFAVSMVCFCISVML